MTLTSCRRSAVTRAQNDHKAWLYKRLLSKAASGVNMLILSDPHVQNRYVFGLGLTSIIDSKYSDLVCAENQSHCVIIKPASYLSWEDNKDWDYSAGHAHLQHPRGGEQTFGWRCPLSSSLPLPPRRSTSCICSSVDWKRTQLVTCALKYDKHLGALPSKEMWMKHSFSPC